MSDFARLEDKLAKLRQRERIAGEGRRLRGGSPEALLASVLVEIDETILPRRLSFHVEDGETVHLAVANRRLQALLSPAPNTGSVLVTDVVDHPLPDAEDPAVIVVRDVLLAAFASGASVAIQSSRPPGRGFPSDIGVPSGILRRAWGIADAELEVLSPGELLSRFIASLDGDAIAWLRIEGEDVTDQGGDASVLETLGDHAAMFLDGYFGKFDALFPGEGGPCATVLGPVDGEGASVFFVDISEVSAFVAARADRILALSGKWQRLVAGEDPV